MSVSQSSRVSLELESKNEFWVDRLPEPQIEQREEVAFQSLKARIHESLVFSLDLAAAEGLTDQQLRREIIPFIETELASSNLSLPEHDRPRLIRELQDEMFGLGPLERLMADDSITDILVNHPYEVFFERSGQLELSDVVFADTNHLMRIIQRIVSKVGRRIDEVCPMVDARLPDGSRINAVIPPLALDGPKLSIRRFGKHHLSQQSLVELGTMTNEMSEFLRAAVEARVSILISGGTGAGKTTLLNAFSSNIPIGERVVTIEDSAELSLQHRHVARMETRPANSEGIGEINQRDLVRNSLRMRPDRIIVGEVRGSEALDMLQAMNTGHDGSMTTIHANNARDAISRLEMMIAMAQLEIPVTVARKMIAAGINLIVHVARLKGGVRKVTRIAELRRSEDGYQLDDVFLFRRDGADKEGKAKGTFHATGYRPQCLTRFHEEDVTFDESFLASSTSSDGLASSDDSIVSDVES
jgi:pilus assembly protein CpaF